jgi:hypothetical protein
MSKANMVKGDGIAGIKAFQPLYTLNATGASVERRRCQEHRRQWCWDNTMSTNDAGSEDSDEVPCPVCSKAFDSEHGMKIHKGHEHGPNTVECDVCGAEFRRPPANVNQDGATLCSQECERKNRGFAEPITYQCDQCGETATQQANEFHRYEHNFCSAECKYEWQSQEFAGKGSPRYGNGDATDIPCSNCGDTVHVHGPDLRQNENHFCDDDCYAEWLSMQMAGEGNHQYIDGSRVGEKDVYGRGWTSEKKETVRERDGRQCRYCGMTESEHIDEYGRRLDVHHIIPARMFKNAAERNAMENLEAVCAPCHQRVEQMTPLRPETSRPMD